MKLHIVRKLGPGIVLFGLVVASSTARAGSGVSRRDFNGDGHDDLLCENIDRGEFWIDYANASGQFNGTNWNAITQFCIGASETAELKYGDFNGDGRTDMLCRSGQTLSIDYADAWGQFLGADWSRTSTWCTGSRQNLHVGDFNGDGRSDLLCHNDSSGTLWIDYAGSNANQPFQGTDWTRATIWPLPAWCAEQFTNFHELRIGDFNGDGHDDLLCDEQLTGDLWIDYWESGEVFLGADWHGTQGCRDVWDSPTQPTVHYGRYIADYDGDGRDDMLCWPVEGSMLIWLDNADSGGNFTGPNYTFNNWCDIYATGAHWVGDYDGDGYDDLFCHKYSAGGDHYIDYAGGRFEEFFGYDWSRNANWCGASRQRLYGADLFPY